MSARFLAICEKSLLKSSPERVYLNRIGATWDGSLSYFVWGCKRPQSMPATYAPGPRLNDPEYTIGFWACLDQNTTYLALMSLYPQHVGGLPVERSWDELGTGWVRPGGNRSPRALLNRVDQGEVEGVCGKLGRPCGGSCGNLVHRAFQDLDAPDRGADLGRSLLALGVGVLEDGQGALQPVFQNTLQDVDLALHVDEGGLQLFHVDGAGELQVQLVQREQVREGHRIAHDHHVAHVGADDRAPAHVVGGVRDYRKGERSGQGWVDVLADLAHAPLDLSLDLAGQLGAPVGVHTRLGQLLEGDAGHPLRVHGEQLAAGEAKGKLDDLAADPDVALQHLGRQVAQRLLQDVLAGRAAARATGDDAFEPFQARAGLFLDGLARGQCRADTLQRRLRVGEAVAQLGRPHLLCLAAGVEPGLEVRNFADMTLGAAAETPYEGAHERDAGQEAYQ